MKLTLDILIFILLFVRNSFCIEIIKANDITNENNGLKLENKKGPLPVFIIHGIMTGAPSMLLIEEQIEIVR